ncbi:MAG: shikimate kinase AroK [Gammaproteobacteria bacterium]
MQNPRNIFLIGPMGVGKSTIGRQLATLMGMEFEDTDHEIQRRTGVDISTVFDFEGEEGFRRREKQVVEDMTLRSGLVLATGGGVVLDPENRRALSGRGVVVYLSCSPEQQYRRTKRDRNRPLLQTEDKMSKLRNLMDEREPLYLEMADLVVSTEKRSANVVAKEIVTRLGEIN